MKGELVSMKMMMMSENQSNLPQVNVTVILGTDETMLRTQLTLFSLGEENIYLVDFDVKLRKNLLSTLF